MNQKLCPVCNTVNTNTDKCVNCGNMFALPNTQPVITSNVLDNMPIASTIPISTVNNIAPPLSSLENANNNVQNPVPVMQTEQMQAASPVMPAPQPVAPVIMPAPTMQPVIKESVQAPTSVQNVPNQVLPQMQVLLGQEPTLAKPEVKQENIKIESKFNIFKYIFKAFVKPYDEFKNNEECLSKPKNNLLIALILVLSITIFSLFGTMIDAVRHEGFLTGTVTWVWSDLKDVMYFKTILINFFAYSILMYVIAGVYFLAGLVIKKDVNFMKISSSVLTAFIPVILVGIIVSITSWFLPTLLVILMYIFSLVYSFVSFIELINEQVSVENKNNRIYFNFTCISILFVLAILGLKLLTSI